MEWKALGKKKSNTPRVKRTNRQGRLDSAAAGWLKTYSGKRHIHGYRKHFGVDVGTAISELRMLGVPLTDEAVRKAKEGAQAAARAKQARKEKRRQRQEERQRNELPCSDETFAFIVGYTEWGFPYGVTWEEAETYADRESLDAAVPPRNRERQAAAGDNGRPFIEARESEEVPFDLEAFMRYHAKCGNVRPCPNE